MKLKTIASRAGICGVGICLLIGSAWGQVALPTAPGRALDSSLQVRTGGLPTTGGPLNTAVPLNTGNPLITGNVRWGRGFQGRINYTNPFAFRGRLQSSRLNTFRSNSLTYQDLRTGTVPLRGAVPYYPTNSTILGYRETAAGQSRFGTNQPFRTDQRPVSASVPLDPRLGTTSRLEGYAVQGASPLDVSLVAVGLPTRSALSLLDPTVSAALPAVSTAGGREMRGLGYVLPSDPRLGGDPLEPLGSIDLAARESSLRDGRVRAPSERAGPMEAQVAGPTGEDIFEDLKRLTELSGPDQPEGPGVLWHPLAPDAPAASEVEAPSEPTKVETFAGSKPTPLNKYLRDAEGLMKAGEYERATGKYRIASLLDSDNPLPHLGWANALMGRRMFSSAAFHLRAAVSRFPKLAEVEMDLPSFYPSRVMFAQVLMDLLREIKKPRTKPDAGLHLLMGYAFYFSRSGKDGAKRTDDAIRHMQIILTTYPADKEARAFLKAFEASRKAAGAAAK